MYLDLKHQPDLCLHLHVGFSLFMSVSKYSPVVRTLVILDYDVLMTSSLLPWWLSGKESTCQCRSMGSTLGLGRSPAEGHGDPLQYLLYIYIYNFIYLFIYDYTGCSLLCELSLVVVTGGFSLQWLPLLRRTGSVVVAHRLGCSEATS